jgi:uncharacterized protein
VSLFAFPSSILGILLTIVTVAIHQPVTEDGAVLSSTDRERIAAQLVALRERTGVQMAVVFVNESLGEPVEDFSYRTAMAWRGGEAGNNNGILLTFALADHRMRLEVGRGLEDAIPDEDARTWLDEARPMLRRSEYANAALSVIGEVSQRIGPGGRGVHPAWYARMGRQRSGFLLTAILAFLAGGALGIYWERVTKPDPKRRRLYAIATFTVLPLVTAMVLGSGVTWMIGYAFATASLALLAWGTLRIWVSGYSALGFCILAAMLLTTGLQASAGFTPVWSDSAFFFIPFVAAIFGIVAALVPGLPLQAMSNSGLQGTPGAGVTYDASGGSSSSSSWWGSSSSDSSSWSSSSSYSSSDYSSSNSYSSSDSSSSSSYSSSDYSGGGGDFGGGGASSGW